MSVRTLQTASLLAATIASGLMAGVFGLYAHTIMRGLGKSDDRTFVGAFQALDRAIINPLFVSTFVGALLFGGLATVTTWSESDRSVLPWVVTATLLYLAIVMITVAIHVPLNDAIKSAGDVDRMDNLAQVRADFHENRWIAWNIVRAIANTVAFACLTWALVLHGRATEERVSSAPAAPTAAPLVADCR